MIILYIGPHNRPDFSTDFLLSPLLAPESLLARFPRTWMLTGERDPLVDDTVIFAGRLRQAKRAEWVTAKELGLDWARGEFREEDVVNVDLIPGISHGFLQFVGVFPEGWKYILRCGKWMDEAFDAAERDDHGEMGLGDIPGIPYDPQRHKRRRDRENSDYFGSTLGLAEAVNGLSSGRRSERHHYRTSTQSSADDDRPLEMTVLRHSSISKGKGKASPPKDVDAVNGMDEMANGAGPVGVGRRADRGRGRGRGKREARRKSLVSLASEDDLLGRRMKGLTGGLLGDNGIDEDL